MQYQVIKLEKLCKSLSDYPSSELFQINNLFYIINENSPLRYKSTNYIIMKNDKLKLNTLNIKSFVTNVEKEKALTVKGGLYTQFFCPTLANPHPCKAPTRDNASECVCL